MPVKSVSELIDYAKANPGRVTIGSAGNGSSNHLSGELLNVLTKVPMEHVPYKGPEVPSMDESGVAGHNEARSDLWFGIVGPAGIPKPIVPSGARS